MKNFGFLFFAVLLASCTTDVLDVDAPSMNSSEDINALQTYTHSEGETILGDKIEIPYTVENLLKAMDLLTPETRSQINIEDIYATHYYVRFSPKDREELNLLEEVKPRLMLSETPLDREILVGGTSYHDPTLSKDTPTYQYTTIEVNRWRQLIDTLSVEGEILLEAYMPDYYTEEETRSFSALTPTRAMEELFKVAYQMCGHSYEIATRASEWYPSGTITAYDNIVGGQIPIKGVRVRGTRFLTIKEDLTDEYGYYSLGSFKNDVNMKVIWEGERWDIRDGGIAQANYNGPKVSSNWSLAIKATEPHQIGFASLHRAAYRCYCGENGGLSRPDHSRREKIVLKKEVTLSKDAEGRYTRQNFLGIGNDIIIAGLKTATTWEDASVLFSVTSHELGHAIHCTNIKKGDYRDSEQRLRETWATFIQYFYTRMEYKELGVENKLCGIDYLTSMEYPDCLYNFQYRDTNPLNSGYFQEYTPLLIDLVDDYNQLTYYLGVNPSIHPDDIVRNFPVTLIEEYLFDCFTFGHLKDKLTNYAEEYPYNSYCLTKENISKLFYVYEE